MMNSLIYKGYSARVQFDPRDDIFVGHVLGVKESITFHGETVAELHADFAAALEHYFADCAASGREPQKPASGRLMLRVPLKVMQLLYERLPTVERALTSGQLRFL